MSFNLYNKLNLLYIEDDINIGENYKKTFELIFNKVYMSTNYTDAIEIYSSESIDLLIIDIELEESKNGFDIVSFIRKKDINTPLIILSSHDQKESFLKAINFRVNGYIIKPLDVANLFDILKNIFNFDKNTIEFDEFNYNFVSKELFNGDNKKIILGKKENNLLEYLLIHKNRTISREELEYEIWNELLNSSSTLKTLISALRKKMGKNVIINESKIGWRIDID